MGQTHPVSGLKAQKNVSQREFSIVHVVNMTRTLLDAMLGSSCNVVFSAEIHIAQLMQKAG